MNGFAKTPPPPYYAVIFTSQRQGDEENYGVTADRMVDLAQQQSGFLGVESVRGEDGLGITVSYWKDETSIAGWRRNLEHVAARERGRTAWYSHYELRVAYVERAYGKKA